jgi:hypothetical protein
MGSVQDLVEFSDASHNSLRTIETNALGSFTARSKSGDGPGDVVGVSAIRTLRL